MPKWEYKYIETLQGANEDIVLKAINDAKVSGWRLLSFNPLSISGMLMEREIPNPNPFDPDVTDDSRR